MKRGYTTKYWSMSVPESIVARYADMGTRLEKLTEEIERRRVDLAEQMAKQDVQQIKRAKRQLRECEVVLTAQELKSRVSA